MAASSEVNSVLDIDGCIVMRLARMASRGNALTRCAGAPPSAPRENSMTRIRLLQSCAMACLISSISACGGDAALAFGYGCEVGDPSACASGVCESWSDGTTRCTAACSTDVPCPVSLDDSPEYTCNPARGGGLCDVLCTDGALVEDDNATYVCLDSEFFDCGEATAAEGCSLCGCEPYGGGVCVPGTGCVEPAVNGTVCSDPRECISGTCGYATMICQDPAALAAPCFADEDCASRNCSNDGNHAIEGVCNMPFGEICEGAANCNRCVGANAFRDFSKGPWRPLAPREGVGSGVGDRHERQAVI